MRNSIIKIVCIGLLIGMALAALSPTRLTPASVQAQDPTAEALPWWNDRIFYEIFVRSFYDSDGDGIGDLQGIIQKLDYLNDGDPTTTTDLGVTGIWLMPIMASPSYHGYDVVDYYTINPDYGTMDDFKQLLEEAHQRGIAVIIDLVLNHTSSEHPWFVAARQNDPAYRDFYLWSETNPSYLGPWGQEVWHETPSGYYYGIFWSGMPDLNYANPDVTDAVLDIVDFWAGEIGVDGFRLDAIQHLIEDGQIQANSQATLTWFSGFQDYIDSQYPDLLTVGEVWAPIETIAPYIGERVDIAFDFDLAFGMMYSANEGLNAGARANQNLILRNYPHAQYAAFLTNHDQNRVMSELARDVTKAKLAATLLLTQPGVPFIYYGEEIGMAGQKPDERIRTPMQWDSTEGTAGFTTGEPWQRLASRYADFNVAVMDNDLASLLNHYRTLIHLRNAEPILRYGKMVMLYPNIGSVHAFLRVYEGEVMLVLMNLSEDAVSDYHIELPDSPLRGEYTPSVWLFGEGEIAPLTFEANGGFSDYVPMPELAPQSAIIVKFEQ